MTAAPTPLEQLREREGELVGRLEALIGGLQQLHDASSFDWDVWREAIDALGETEAELRAIGKQIEVLEVQQTRWRRY